MEKGVSRMEKGVSTMENGVSTMEKGVSTVEKGVSTMEKGVSTMEEEVFGDMKDADELYIHGRTKNKKLIRVKVEIFFRLYRFLIIEKE